MKVSNSFQQKLLKIHQSMGLWCDYLEPSTFFFAGFLMEKKYSVVY